MTNPTNDQLDRHIATAVMGRRESHTDLCKIPIWVWPGGEFTIQADWSPSTSIADAWEAMGEYWKTRRTRYCTIRQRGDESWVFTLSVSDLDHLETSADTPARAISLALYRATRFNDE
jgi:hypothetical protein